MDTVFHILFSVLFLLGPQPEINKKIVFENSRSYEIKVEKVWRTLSKILIDNSYLVKQIDEKQFRIECKTIPGYAHDYTTTTGTYVETRMTMNIIVQDNSDSTRVQINIECEGKSKEENDRWGSYGHFDKLYSNGKYEKKIFKRLDKLLKEY